MVHLNTSRCYLKMGIPDGKLADGVIYVPLGAAGEVLGVNVAGITKLK